MEETEWEEKFEKCLDKLSGSIDNLREPESAEEAEKTVNQLMMIRGTLEKIEKKLKESG